MNGRVGRRHRPGRAGDPVELRGPVRTAVLEVVVVQAELAGLGREAEPLLAGADRPGRLLPRGEVDPDPVGDARSIAVVGRPAAAVHPPDGSVDVAKPELD